MSRVIRFASPSRLVSIEDLDGEMRKHGIPEHARAAAVEVARAFDAGFKIPKADFSFELPEGLSEEQAAAINARIHAAVTRYHEAWHLALLDFSGSLQHEAVKAAIGIKPGAGRPRRE